MQVDLLAQDLGTVAAVNMPDNFKSQAQTHWRMTQLGFNTTRLVRDLCAVLESLQVPFQTGVSEAKGLLRIDIALSDQWVCSLQLKPISLPACYVSNACILCYWLMLGVADTRGAFAACSALATSLQTRGVLAACAALAASLYIRNQLNSWWQPLTALFLVFANRWQLRLWAP